VSSTPEQTENVFSEISVVKLEAIERAPIHDSVVGAALNAVTSGSVATLTVLFIESTVEVN
jgi:hypothetical protein